MKSNNLNLCASAADTLRKEALVSLSLLLLTATLIIQMFAHQMQILRFS